MTIEISRRSVMGAAAALPLAHRADLPAAAPAERSFRGSQATLTLDPVTQTARSLAPNAMTEFDFLPGAHLRAHHGDGWYALGDIDLRLRALGGEWRDYSSAFHRAAVRDIALGDGDLAAADLAPLFPRDMPLDIVRRWQRRDDELVVSFDLSNRADTAIEIGGLGFAMPFDNILTGRTLDEAHDQASFTEPYIGLDAGYVIVARLNGRGPVLLVLPEPGTPLEAWKPIPSSSPSTSPELLKDRTERRVTFEGFYDWMVATGGFAAREWHDAEQWNPPSTITLAPGGTRRFGFRLVLAASIRGIEDRLAAAGRPVVAGLSGYVVAPDADCALFVRATSAVTAITVSPAGALTVALPTSMGRWRKYTVAAGDHSGRARVTLGYADGTRQSVHYFVIKPPAQAVADLGRHSFSAQWFDSPGDRFGRSPSVMTYDRGAQRIVASDRRVYVAGLSDEAGAGPWLAAIMKQLDNPDVGEIAKFERFHTHVVEGNLQVQGGADDLGVRKSVFYYDPARAADYDPDVDWSRWPSWTTAEAFKVSRSFNYPHVAAAQWVLYRLARNHVGLVTAHDWRWYLDRAARTTLAMCRLAAHDVQFGNMEGSVFLAILLDLQREGMRDLADAVEAVMRKRANHWATLRYPFGSEMPWDSTGQEEVHSWMRYFGDADKAAVTREVILAYDHSVPHWGYNGSARRYWDFRIAAKLQREERQLHHYGSAINALPLFIEYRLNPDDFHLLRVAYGGLQGSITNIDRDGFASAAFHAWPDALRFDDYTGDYGPSFFAHAFGTASYLVHHDEFGWVAFGGRLSETSGAIAIAPADSARSRCFVAPAGLWITLDAGKLAEVRYDPASGDVTLSLAPASPITPLARVRLETTVAGARAYRPAGKLMRERDAWVVPLDRSTVEVSLHPGARTRRT